MISILPNRLSVVLLIVLLSGDATGFMNGGRTFNGVTSLQAAKEASPSEAEAESSTATIEKSEDAVLILDDDEDEDDAEGFDSVLRSRRTINGFLSDLPEDWEETLQSAVRSAIYAPNHKRTEPWRFHLLGPEAIRKVCDLNASLVTEKKGAKAGQAKLERWLEMPGWLVVTCATTPKESAGTMEDPAGIEREDYAAVCCAVQNLCLSLHNAGMGTKWTTGPVNFDKKFGDIVGFDDEEEYVVGTIWFGTPLKTPEPPPKKKSLKDVLRRTN